MIAHYGKKDFNELISSNVFVSDIRIRIIMINLQRYQQYHQILPFQEWLYIKAIIIRFLLFLRDFHQGVRKKYRKISFHFETSNILLVMHRAIIDAVDGIHHVSNRIHQKKSYVTFQESLNQE